MTNIETAKGLENLMKSFYKKNVICKYENNYFVLSAKSHKTLKNMCIDLVRGFAMSGKKIKFENAGLNIVHAHVQ